MKKCVSLLVCILLLLGLGACTNTEKELQQKKAQAMLCAMEEFKTKRSETPDYNFESYVAFDEDQKGAYVNLFYAGVFTSEGFSVPPISPLYYILFNEGIPTVAATFEGEDFSSSPGVWINVSYYNNRLIVWGNIWDTAWNSYTDQTTPLECKALKIITPKAKFLIDDIGENGVFVGIIDSPPTDFQIINQEGKVTLDYKQFQEMGHQLKGFSE